MLSAVVNEVLNPVTVASLPMVAGALTVIDGWPHGLAPARRAWSPAARAALRPTSSVGSCART